MGLSSEHIPFDRSLRDRVVDNYSSPDDRAHANALARGDVVSYLAKSQDTDSSPLATIKRRAARDGRNAALARDDHAILTWVCEAFSEWEERFGLEAPLRDQVHRLLPLTVAVALRDESFFIPGRHPLHQLLDALQEGAVGWQVRLDRAGQMLEQRIERSVEKALEWFNTDRIDIAQITRELAAANERDAARAQRMIQRLEEAEEARLRTVTARRDAAGFINEGLARFELPSAIGEFVTGPWYDSAQLVLVKFGKQSPEWDQMRRVTRQLMESVQDIDPDDASSTDRRNQLLRHLPGELRRWLISLEHDSESVDGAVGLVEYAHLRIQHGQQLVLTRFPPIEIADEIAEDADGTSERFENGEWYLFQDDEGDLRARLVLQLEQGRHLLFANFVGLKALDLPLTIFAQRLEDSFARHLPNKDTFSISLAAAAGIDSEERLRAFIDPDYRPPREDPAPNRPEPAPAQERAGSDAQTRDTALERTRAEEFRRASPHEDDDDPVLRPPAGAETALTLDIDLDDAGDGAEGPPSPAPTRGPGHDAAAPPAAPAPPAPQPAAQPYRPPQPPVEPAPPAPQPEAQPYRSPPPPVEPAPSPPPAQEAPRPAEPAMAPPPRYPDPAPPPPPPAPPVSPAPVAATREVDVPMGAWLGFHDGETPLMAKLAVYDPRRDNFIFVNRKGIALRELNRSELLALMDQGLVDILETRSYFREEVERARGENK